MRSTVTHTQFRTSGLSRFRSLAAALILLTALAGCTIWKPVGQPGWRSATSPDQFERLMWDEVKAGNMKEVIQHLGSTFVAMTPEGRRDRAAQIEYLSKLKLTGFEIAELDSTHSGDDAIVTYVLTLHGTAGDQPLATQPMRVMTVWRVAQHGWMAVAQSVTPAGTPAGAPSTAPKGPAGQ